MGKINPNLSYYCKLHAAQTAMRLSPQTPEIKAFVGALLTDLEANPANEPKEATLTALENVAINAFNHADQVDRAGNADVKTVKAFTTVFVLLSVLKGQQKDDFDPEHQEKIKYSMFKSTDIFKCIKAGIKPKAGPPGMEEEEEEEPVAEEPQPEPSNPWAGGNDGGMSMGMNMGMNEDDALNSLPDPNTSAPAAPSSGGFGGFNTQPIMPVANKKPTSRPVFNPSSTTKKTSNNSHGANFEQKIAACAHAETIMKHAFSAMRFNDVEAACQKLEEALNTLQPFR